MKKLLELKLSSMLQYYLFLKFYKLILKAKKTKLVRINIYLIKNVSKNQKCYFSFLFRMLLTQYVSWANRNRKKVSSGTGILYKFRNKSENVYLPVLYLLVLDISSTNKALKILFNLPLRYITINLFKRYPNIILSITKNNYCFVSSKT